jgi:hypothetical protein
MAASVCEATFVLSFLVGPDPEPKAPRKPTSSTPSTTDSNTNSSASTDTKVDTEPMVRPQLPLAQLRPPWDRAVAETEQHVWHPTKRLFWRASAPPREIHTTPLAKYLTVVSDEDIETTAEPGARRGSVSRTPSSTLAAWTVMKGTAAEAAAFVKSPKTVGKVTAEQKRREVTAEQKRRALSRLSVGPPWDGAVDQVASSHDDSDDKGEDTLAEEPHAKKESSSLAEVEEEFSLFSLMENSTMSAAEEENSTMSAAEESAARRVRWQAEEEEEEYEPDEIPDEFSELQILMDQLGRLSHSPQRETSQGLSVKLQIAGCLTKMGRVPDAIPCACTAASHPCRSEARLERRRYEVTRLTAVSFVRCACAQTCGRWSRGAWRFSAACSSMRRTKLGLPSRCFCIFKGTTARSSRY